MAYTELIKHFQRVRHYMHEFYIYGFKDRNNMSLKSKRSYDNEKRRLESYLQDYMSFQYKSSKSVFLSIDSRQIIHNPLYHVFQAKSFTNKDITLHFYILDILYDSSLLFTFQDIVKQIDLYLSYFDQKYVFDESTIRKKIKEYVSLGILKTHKEGKALYYQRNSSFNLNSFQNAIHYYTEIMPLGVIGSYMLPYIEHHSSFSFKHHYIVHAIDSEILENILEAMHQKQEIQITNHQNHIYYIIPLRLYISSQNGRCHLLAYTNRYHTIKTYRIDHIKDIKPLSICQDFDKHRRSLLEIEKHIWSVQCHQTQPLEHVSFTIQIMPYENYILQRLKREKRNGIITQIDDITYQFSIDIYETYEIIPWIRTFIGRIKQLNFSNRTLENQFKQDILKMYDLYQIKGSE